MVTTRSRTCHFKPFCEARRQRLLAVCKICDIEELSTRKHRKHKKSRNVAVCEKHKSNHKKLQKKVKMENDFLLEGHNSPKILEDANIFDINDSATCSSSSPRSSQSAEEDFDVSSSRRYPKRHRTSITNISGKPEHFESEGIRRSTRPRKLIYDNFNTSFILDTQVLRNYSLISKKGFKNKAGIKDKYVQTKDCQSNTETDSAKRNCRNGRRESSSLDDSSNDMFSSVKMSTNVSQQLNSETGNIDGRKEEKNSECSERCHESTSETTSEEDHRDDNRKTKYHLRKPKPTVQQFQANGDPPRRSGRRFGPTIHDWGLRTRNRAPSSSTTTTSTTEDNECYKKSPKRKIPRRIPNTQVHGEYAGSAHGSHMDITAISERTDVDKDIFFSHVGGLKYHIQTLTDLILVPKRYPEVFSNFNVKPVKGILFYGPPGTGKTHLARALGNECSRSDRDITSYSFNGTEILQRYVGDSELYIRLIFQKAYQNRPSVIFFDELDGLAPCRSIKQEHIHTSIVTTLLACMDGIGNSNEVLVIGATNRIDAIDPALRRSGRFDRELYFPLPTAKERFEILRIAVKKWPTAPRPTVLKQVAHQTYGFSGADLSALCSDAVRKCFKRHCPQVFESDIQYNINPFDLKVNLRDFMAAMSEIVPSSRRVSCTAARRVPYPVGPLVNKQLESLYEIIKENFPYAISHANSDKAANFNRPVCQSRLLITADTDIHGQTTYIAPALLCLMDHIFCKKIDLATLHEVSVRTPEEACIQIFQEISRNTPSVLYLPRISQWWDLIPESVQSIFLSEMKSLSVTLPVLILATSEVAYEFLPQKIRLMFSKYRKEVFDVQLPDEKQRTDFFSDLFKNATSPVAPPEENVSEPPLLVPENASPELSKLSEKELQDLYNEEEITLSELRTCLRNICSKLAYNRSFAIFKTPVDVEIFRDYLSVIDKPMDLETMKTKIDLHEYQTAQQFIDDIDLICSNALLYNPDKNPTDKDIRHQACCLHDTAYSLVKKMLTKEFESKCKDIAEDRKRRNFSPFKFAPRYCRINRETTLAKVSSGSHEGDVSEACSANDNITSNNNSSFKLSSKLQNREFRKRRRPSCWARGEVASKRKRPAKQLTAQSDSPDLGTRNINPRSKMNNTNCTIKGKPVTPHETPKGHYLEKMDIDYQGPSTSRQFVTQNSSELAQRNADHGFSPDSDMEWESFDSHGDFEKDLPLMAEDCPTNCFVERLDDDGTVQINRKRLSSLTDEAVKITAGCSVDEILDVCTQLCKIISKYAKTVERASLIMDLQEELERFKLFRVGEYL